MFKLMMIYSYVQFIKQLKEKVLYQPLGIQLTLYSNIIKFRLYLFTCLRKSTPHIGLREERP